MSARETILDTIECYKECPRRQQFVDMAIRDIPIEDVEKLYKYLQGEVPENLTIKCPVKLSSRKAFQVIYYLQEIMLILPDSYERCITCGDLFDSDNEGNFPHCEYCRRD